MMQVTIPRVGVRAVSVSRVEDPHPAPSPRVLVEGRDFWDRRISHPPRGMRFCPFKGTGDGDSDDKPISISEHIPTTMRTSEIHPSLFPLSPDAPFAALSRAVRGDEFWEPRIKSLLEDSQCRFTLHLAILVNPWLQRLLDGRKTVESRFSVFRQPPFGCVEADDVILLKKSGGRVVGVCQAAETRSYVLNPDILARFATNFPTRSVRRRPPSGMRERAPDMRP